MIFVWIFLLIHITLFLQATSPPLIVKIGGLFSPVSSNSTHHQEAAFLLALKHINDKSDGIYDHLLPNTMLKYGVRVEETPLMTLSSMIYLLNEATFTIPSPSPSPSPAAVSVSHGVDILISSIDSFQSNSLMFDLISSTEVSVFTGISTNRFEGIHLSPERSNQGKYLQKLMCGYFNYRRVSVFASSNEFGMESYKQLTDGLFCELEVLSYIPTSYDSKEFVIDALHAMDDLNSRVYVILVDDVNLGAYILEQGFFLDIFREGRQVFVSDILTTPDTWDHLTISHSYINRMMRGVIGLRSSSTHSVSSDSFISEWISQRPTRNSSGWCSSSEDDTLEGNKLFKSSSSTPCHGVDFSSFSLSRTEFMNELGEFVTPTYDAVMSMALALHELIEVEGKSKILKSDVYQTIKKMRPYEGASGNISFDSNGVRLGGVMYDVVNFNPEAVSSFALIGSIGSTIDFTPCSLLTTYNCKLPKFYAHDNAMLPDGEAYARDGPPEVIKVGGFFNPFDESGKFDSAGAQYLASFLMAIREINNKSDGILDDLLPGTELVVAIESAEGLMGGEEAALYFSNQVFGTGIDVAVSALNNHYVSTAHVVFNEERVPMVHSVATLPELGDGVAYPYKVGITPVETYQGMVFQSILCDYFKYRKFSVIASANYFGVKATVESHDDTFCVDNMLSEHTIYANGNIDELISELKFVGSQIFLLLFPSEFIPTVAKILEKGFEAGVFHSDTQIFGSEQITGDGLIASLSETNNVESIMKGYIGIQYYPNYAIRHNEAGKSFIERWRNQPPTLGGLNEDNQWECEIERDDADHTLLYRNLGKNLIENVTCSGLNFSSFHVDGSDLAPYVGHTYDATVGMVRALDYVLRTKGMGHDDDAEAIMAALINNVTFEGTTGPIDIFEGMSEFGNYGRGNREIGHSYKLLNFKSDKYAMLDDQSREKTSQSRNSFVEVGVWTLEGGLILNDMEITYRTKSGYPAREQPPDEYVGLSGPVRYFLLSLGVFSLLLCVIFSGLVYYYKQHKYLRASQLRIMSLILVGGMFSSGRVIVASLPITTPTCITGLWLGHIGFLLVFITLSVKTYRLYRLLGALKRVKFTESQAIHICLGVVSLACVYLSFMTAFGEIRLSDVATSEHNQKTRLMKCAMTYPEMHTTLFVVESLILMIGFYFAYKTKDAPDAVNEAQYISAAAALITIVCSLVFPLIFLIGSITPPTRQLIATMSFGIVTIGVMCIIFIPKIIIVLNNPTPTKDLWTANSSQSNNSQLDSTHGGSSLSAPPTSLAAVVELRTTRYGGAAAISPEYDIVESFQDVDHKI